MKVKSSLREPCIPFVTRVAFPNYSEYNCYRDLTYMWSRIQLIVRRCPVELSILEAPKDMNNFDWFIGFFIFLEQWDFGHYPLRKLRLFWGSIWSVYWVFRRIDCNGKGPSNFSISLDQSGNQGQEENKLLLEQLNEAYVMNLMLKKSPYQMLDPGKSRTWWEDSNMGSVSR